MDEEPRHDWRTDSATLLTQGLQRCKTQTWYVHLALKAYGINPGGLLQAMFEDAEFPVSAKRALIVRKVLKHNESPRLAEILSTPVELLLPNDIHELVKLIDNVVDGFNTVSKRYETMNCFWHFLRQCRTPLANGELLAMQSMKSRFIYKVSR